MHIDSSIQLPPKNYQHIIKEFSHLIPDTTLKLRFLREAINERFEIRAPYRYYTPLAESVYRKTLLDKIDIILPGSKKRAKKLMRQGVISTPREASWGIHKFRHVAALVIVTFLFWGFGISMPSLLEVFNSFEIKNIFQKQITENNANSGGKVNRNRGLKADFPKYLKEPIWLVERKQNREIYSNRLNIITSHTVKNLPRSYFSLPKNFDQLPSQPRPTNKIAGILYHATESDILPFKPEMNKSIKRYSRALIRYLKKNKSYHYLIDRFGRVYRLVQEDHAAFHAGRSIWADKESFYLNLNNAFIGISFEGKDFEKIKGVKPSKHQEPELTVPHIRPMDNSSINEAQLRSGKELTDWLRVKYNIPQNNCVPHALASVNSGKMLIGHHYDLSRGFPFHQFGLSDKYKEPLPSIVDFGFTYNSYFKNLFDNNIWPGIHNAEELLSKRAKEKGMNLYTFQKKLRHRYTRYMQWLKTQEKKREKLLAKQTR
jgi:hypothetical protein